MTDIPRMSYVHRIIAGFGGVRATAQAVGCSPSTVQGWKDRGTIPDSKKRDVLAASRRLNLGFVPADFLPDDLLGPA